MQSLDNVQGVHVQCQGSPWTFSQDTDLKKVKIDLKDWSDCHKGPTKVVQIMILR